MNVLQHTRNERNPCLKQNRPDRSYRDTLLTITKTSRVWRSADNTEPLALRGSLTSLAAHLQPFLRQLALYHVVPALGH